MSFVVEIPSVFTKPTQIPVRLGNTILSGNETIQGALQVNGSLTLNVGSSNTNTVYYDSLDISNALSAGNTILNDVSCNKVFVHSLTPTLSSELTTKSYIETSFSKINIFSNALSVPRTIISNLSPNIWAVAGESVDRVNSATISITSGLAVLDSFYGKPVWSIMEGANIGQNPPVIINSFITQASTTYTISIACATFLYASASLFLQQPISRTSGHVSKHIGYGNGSISSDEFSPSGGGINFDIIHGIHTHNNAITVRRSSGTITLYFNGNLVSSKSVSETYNGDTVDRIGLGGRPSNSQTTKGGLRMGGCVVWNRSLTDNEIKLLTYDNITAF